MSVTPYLMLETLAADRRKDLTATAGARRRIRSLPEVCERAKAVEGSGLLARFRHAPAA